jgi:glycosyltransferase involved in cell wall biosynthesis
MIRVAALTSGRNVPSARFRIRQHIAALEKHDVQVTECCPLVNQHSRLPGKLSMIRTRYLPPVLGAQMFSNIIFRIPGIFGTHKSDLVWLERSFLPGLEVLVRVTKSPRILDVDDAVWLMNPLGEQSARYLVRNVDAVIAGNNYVADWYSDYCRKVYIVPTAIDCQRFVPKQDGLDSERNFFVIGWTGTSANFKYLKLIEKPLASFLRHHKESRLLIMADRRPVFELIPESQVVFAPWTVQTESTILHKIDVGIMPLTDDDWTRGKCSFKMLQYMATGIPVVVSDVGMNSEILKKGFCGFGANNNLAWYQHIELLYSDQDIRANLGRVGREIVEKNYSVNVVSKQLAEVFFNFV